MAQIAFIPSLNEGGLALKTLTDSTATYRPYRIEADAVAHAAHLNAA